MKKQDIRFGYEIDSGKEVDISLAHTVITGLTQEAGKTTAIMGLIRRSGLKALIIKTKIGEKAITEGALIPPFYREDFDWEYAVELLESSRKEKLKFERSWIIKYSKSATSLLEFKRNIDDALANGKMRDLERSVLITLQAYLEKILPELQYAPLSKTLDLQDGINIMDLERFKEETQGLVIRSVLNEVLTREKNTIVVIPEAWKYLPEQLASPVKRPAEAFIRQGATNNNYLWIDSQDITGVAKKILKQVSNWVLGYQREKNEIQRSLDQIPLNKKSKPQPEEIATLKLGQFYVATSKFTLKAYAQPSWLDDATAIKVAQGKLSIDDVEQPTYTAPFRIITKEQPQEAQVAVTQDSGKKLNELRNDFISNRNDFFNKFDQINETIRTIQTEIFDMKQSKEKIDEDEIVMRVLQKMPVNTNVTSQKPYSHLDEESLIRKIMDRIPRITGSTILEVAPLEKIKKTFMEDAKNKILGEVAELNDREKKMLKHIEAQGKEVKTNEIIIKVWLISDGTSSRKQASEAAGNLLAKELIRKGTHGGFMPNTKSRLTSMLSLHGATEQEIETVYNHILAGML